VGGGRIVVCAAGLVGAQGARYPVSFEHVAMGTASLSTGMHQLALAFHVDEHLPSSTRKE